MSAQKRDKHFLEKVVNIILNLDMICPLPEIGKIEFVAEQTAFFFIKRTSLLMVTGIIDMIIINHAAHHRRSICSGDQDNILMRLPALDWIFIFK